jgi:hypothetical protein
MLQDKKINANKKKLRNSKNFDWGSFVIPAKAGISI